MDGFYRKIDILFKKYLFSYKIHPLKKILYAQYTHTRLQYEMCRLSLIALTMRCISRLKSIFSETFTLLLLS